MARGFNLDVAMRVADEIIAVVVCVLLRDCWFIGCLLLVVWI